MTALKTPSEYVASPSSPPKGPGRIITVFSRYGMLSLAFAVLTVASPSVVAQLIAVDQETDLARRSAERAAGQAGLSGQVATSARGEADSDFVAGAPERYVVRRGDTLSGIAARFLKSPWRWPTLFGMNRAQIKNPNLIYPGDVIVIDRSQGRARLALRPGGEAAAQGAVIGSPTEGLIERPVTLYPSVIERSDETPIPSVSPLAIEPFLNESMVEEPWQQWRTPRILAAQAGRVVYGLGETIFAEGIDPNGPREWMIFRPRNRIIDPETQRYMGRETLHIGKVRFDTVDARVASGEITVANAEISPGDLLFPARPKETPHYVPHAPEDQVVGRVATINSGGLLMTGQGSVVIINRGANDGLEPGHVLALFKSRGRVPSFETNQSVRLPDERFGLVFVFRTFDNVAYALITESKYPVAVGDFIANP